MKIPAIRGKIGTWRYYVSSLTFEQVSKYVRKIDDELHKSETLRDQIQRNITDNVKYIKEYILKKEDRFFNSLVLAIYDGEPQWIEVEMNFGKDEFFNLGVLELSGQEKIFPVDGQHRVEGIKAALLENENLASETVSVILIGHKKDDEGMTKTRRLFTTLNRYAKPVKLNDIIALDEDDIVAIATRELLESFELFQGKRINNSEQKALPESDKTALTSLITLYESNIEIYKAYLRDLTKKPTTNLVQKLRYRPKEEEVNKFIDFSKFFWNTFVENTTALSTYKATEEEPAKQFRNKENGGNLLFRPIALPTIIQVMFDISYRSKVTIEEVIKNFNELNLTISTIPWIKVVWNNVEKTMITGNKPVIRLLLFYLYDKELMSNKELKKLKEKYGALISAVDIESSLDAIET